MASTLVVQGLQTVWITTVRTFDGQPVGTDSSVNVRLLCAAVAG